MLVKSINEFVTNDSVTGYFAVRKKELRDFTRGRYVRLELGDHSGRITGVMWEPDAFALDELAEGMIVKVRAEVTEYQNRAQLTIKQVRLALDSEYTLDQVLPHSNQPEPERRARILALIEQIQNSWTRKLAESFFADEEFLAAFLTAPAGKLWHHATVGGLSEHSVNVATLARQVGANYDFLDDDLLIFGGLLHDVGKVASYDMEGFIDYTDVGRLVGHINLADQGICKHAAQIDDFPDSLLVKLRHMILSHHGEFENASPVLPQMPEAFILYYCDEIDSKMGAVSRIRAKHDGAGWSSYVKLLNRYLYFGDAEE